MSGLLPLSLEVVGTGISWLAMGALLLWRGVACGRQKTRAVGRFENLGFWEDLVFLDGSSRSMELRAGGYCRKLTDPPGWSYDPRLHECSVIPFSIDPRDTSSLFRRSPRSFAQLAMGCSNPPFFSRPLANTQYFVCTEGSPFLIQIRLRRKGVGQEVYNAAST